jgi:RNA polymerase sigma factor (TIGR02999 family)
MQDDPAEDPLREVRPFGRKPCDVPLESVYAELKCIAAECFRGERANHTLTPTAVVHEAWLRLAGPARRMDWRDRRHFFNCAARMMRRVLIDHARSRDCQRRGGGRLRIPIDAEEIAAHPESGVIRELDRCITRLGRIDLELAEIVRLRYYAGLSCEQAASIMGLPLRTFNRRWSLARASLALDLESSHPDDAPALR